MNRILAVTRYAVVIPAIASILGALLLMVQGSIEMIQVIIDAALNSTKLKITIVDVLTAVDAILLGTVLLVIGYGLYELFIDEDLNVPVWLQVHDLDDLKSKLIGVVVATIAVAVRRMHDVGKSGWFILIPIYNLVLVLSPSKGPTYN